ncbi:N-acetylmuramoyl-L-alanine amidase [Streptacidiphilus rugosus]|uniref:N-acetylmuramoyl-L-alanine amidase n=1 Tax=Streptacidiphilus rugosus TaxID=405783 RepID=UPI00068EF68B|nr:N-acetylmuramoyl-L-alanine amidase [Streptacidiphilus rugosus]
MTARHVRKRSRRWIGAAVTLSAGALVVGAVAEAAPGRATAQKSTATAAPVRGALAWPHIPVRPTVSLQQDFTTASAEFHVPVEVLMAVSYEETLWESHGGRPSTTGNYNVMGLTQVSPDDLVAPAQSADGSGADGAASGQSSAASLTLLHTVDTASPALHTLQTAAALAGDSVGQVQTDMAQSVRGGAALLASYEQRLRPAPAAPGGVPADAAQWWPAVVAYAQAETPAAGQQFAARVYTLVQQGASRLTDDNQSVTLTAEPKVRPAELAAALSSPVSASGSGSASVSAECPAGLACSFTPAAYARTAKGAAAAGAGQSAAGGYGNYARADRPTDGDQIQYLVLHDTGGSRSGSLAYFQDPTAEASTHYLVGRDGSVTQLVRTKDIAWHAGNQTLNAHSIGIEQEGFALLDGTWYSESEYQSSAALVKYLAARFGVPLDRQHLLGDDDVPGPVQAKTATMPWGPGPYWDWSHLLALVGAPLTGLHGKPVVGGTVTVAPPYSRVTQPRITGCGAPGATCAAHPANFVYLRLDHASDAPLAGEGTTDAWDWTDRAVYGQTFVVAGVYEDWVSVWYGGRQVWFEDPGWSDTLVPDAAANAALTLVAPADDKPIPVYGRAYPEASAYPAGLASLAASPDQQLSPLADTIAPGQAYLAGPQTSGDFYAQSFDCAGPVGCQVVIGTTQYYPIRFNHRLAFVRASDVQLITPAG